MFDIKLTEQQGVYDFEIEEGDFKIDEGLETALVVSLLSDRRADESQIVQPEFRRGWIGDLVTTLLGYKFGSHLWLSEQSRITQSTLNQVQDQAEKALGWMFDVELVTKIEAVASIINQFSIALSITITSPDGSVSIKAFNLWKRTIENVN